jgi:hypothetical protein
MKGLEFSTRNSMPEPLADFLYVHFSITVYLQLHPLIYTDAYFRRAPIMPHPGCSRREIRAASNHFML